MDKTKLNLERLRAYDAEWEEDKHPRAENGQFTSGSGSAGGGTESGSKYGYSRSEQHVASKMEEWGNEQGNIAALEAADAFSDAREDENDMREVLKSVRQHLVENENDIRGYDENPKNFDKVMEQLDDMESMLDDQDDYEFKHGEIKSPLRQAAEVAQGGGGKKDTNYTANGQQTKADKTIRENPNYVGNDEVYKLLGGKNNVDYFKFITPISARGNINSKDDITIEYGDVYYDDKGERRVSTSTTTFYADKIFKSL